MIGFVDTFLYNLALTQSVTITHNQTTAEDSLHFVSPVSILMLPILGLPQLTTSGTRLSYQYIYFARTTRKTAYCWQSMFTAPLPSSGFLVLRIYFCGNMLSDPLPSNGHGADYIENNCYNSYSIVSYMYFGRCLEMGVHVTICYWGKGPLERLWSMELIKGVLS
jgi:hypothetical protein